MALFLVTFFIMALAVVGMAVGVIFGRTPIAGSCGGLNAVNGSGECRSCSRPCKSRERVQAQEQARVQDQSQLQNSEQTLVQSRTQVLRKLGN